MFEGLDQSGPRDFPVREPRPPRKALCSCQLLRLRSNSGAPAASSTRRALKRSVPGGRHIWSLDKPVRAANLPRMTYDRAYWEQLWEKTLREHADKLAQRPPNGHLIAEVAGLRPGRALDAGCGHGAETLWLAAHGWEVTAVDFSASALAHGRSMAEALPPEIAARITWVEGDLAV